MITPDPPDMAQSSQSDITQEGNLTETNMNTSIYSNISSNKYISFNTNDSISEESFELSSTVNPEVANQLSKYIENKLDYNLPLKCLEKNIKIRNETPGVKVTLPQSTYKIRKAINLKFEHEFYYECPKCKNYTVDNESRSRQLDCQYCECNIEKTLQNFFAYIPLQQQLQESIGKNWESIFHYKQTERDEQYLTDIHDGLICQNMNEKFPHTFNLSLVLNIDGAQVFKSSRKSLWPVQLYQNYLHPRVRYIASNVIVTGLYFGSSKPDPNQLLFPLITELKTIQEAGGFQVKNPESAKNHTFMPFILHGVFDLPAKAMCQGLVQYNGRNACGYCHHPGVKIESKTKSGKKQVVTMYRYVYRGVAEKPRTHEDTLKALQKLTRNKLFDCDGFRKVSPLIGLLGFDTINGFGIDYLHCVYLGVVPRLVGYWLDSKNSCEPYYIKKKIYRIAEF